LPLRRKRKARNLEEDQSSEEPARDSWEASRPEETGNKDGNSLEQKKCRKMSLVLRWCSRKCQGSKQRTSVMLRGAF
jgi:hypothetical protein